MNKIDSILKDVNRGIQVSSSRQGALAASYSLKEDKISELENKLMLIKIMMKRPPSFSVIAEVSNIL